MVSLDKPLVFVDVETTGASPSTEEIIEIGIIRREITGEVTEYSRFIKPYKYVPEWILNYTGIQMNDLENALPFEDTYPEILELLNGGIFVAHNVRFDYGFLKSSFRRVGVTFSASQLCTVKLSRKLFPHQRRHGLDAICEAHNILVGHRHRALDDAKGIFEFFSIVERTFEPTTLSEVIENIQLHAMLPSGVEQEVIKNIPETPGVYTFFGEDSMPLYIGMSINMQSRVISHFASNLREFKEFRLTQGTESIQTIPMAGQFGAKLLESQMIKEQKPIYNKKLRSAKQIVLVRLDTSTEYHSLIIEYAKKIDVDMLPTILAVSKSRRSAKVLIEGIAVKNKLCLHVLGLETSTPCFAYKIGRCNGACIQKETALMHNLKITMAFASTKLKTWPHVSSISFTERNKALGFTDEFTIDNWLLVGCKRYSNETGEELEMPVNMQDHFVYDTYKILCTMVLSKH